MIHSSPPPTLHLHLHVKSIFLNNSPAFIVIGVDQALAYPTRRAVTVAEKFMIYNLICIIILLLEVIIKLTVLMQIEIDSM